VESLEEWLTQPEGLATRLRLLRAQAGLSGKDIADANGWAQSKVSRIESGKQTPSADDITAWCRACAAGNDVLQELLRKQAEARVWNATFRHRMRHGQEGIQLDYAALARESSLIRHFETVFVPGPLQIPEYAHAILTGMRNLHSAGTDDVDQAVAARMQRQQMLYEPGKRFEFLLAEPVLRWLIVPPAVMRAQLDRLQTMIGLERVRFGIIPMGVELATVPQNTVELYTREDGVLAVAETFIGETWHRGDEARRYAAVLDNLWQDAAEGENARQLIVNAALALPR
jgi:transcriptional regulator with XRE-family HTH domain